MQQHAINIGMARHRWKTKHFFKLSLNQLIVIIIIWSSEKKKFIDYRPLNPGKSLTQEKNQQNSLKAETFMSRIDQLKIFNSFS